MPTETKVVLSRVTDYGPKPRSAVQALQQTHAMFVDEGKWVAGTFFQDGDAEEAYEKAFCTSWSACAMGGLGLITGEMPVEVAKEWHPIDLNEVRENWITAVRWDGFDGSLQDYMDREGIKPDGKSETSYHWIDPEPEFNQYDTPLTWRASQFLAWAMLEEEAYHPDDLVGIVNEDPVDTVITRNDNNTRTKVLEWFEKAIEKAKIGKLPTYE